MRLTLLGHPSNSRMAKAWTQEKLYSIYIYIYIDIGIDREEREIGDIDR